MGISKNQLKIITSLSQKKYRQKYGLFIAEGVKVVNELLNSSLELEQLFATDNFTTSKANPQIIDEATLKKISNLKSPNKVLGLFKIPEETELNSTAFTLALDGINDPGNLGTIIRLCDWFGITQLVCSKETVDCYNAKVVQSSMGSLTRVQIKYVDLVDFINTAQLPVFIADMKGGNIYKTQLPKEAILIMGNEANGISNEIKNLVTNRLSIPRFGTIQATESLNVATATAILLSEFKRGLL